MSQSTNKDRGNFRWRLLSSVSALALITGSYGALAGEAKEDRPILWIELGGQFERQAGQGNLPTPPFVAAYPDSAAFQPISIGKLQRVPLYSEGAEGKITFQPEQSDWSFSAGIKFGRSSTHKDVHQGHEISDVEPFTRYPRYSYVSGHLVWQLPKTGTHTLYIYEFAGTQVAQSQKHMILDFAAGRDVGLGMFGKDASSTISAGVRFAQFVSNSSSVIHARPDALFSDYCNAGLAAYFAPIFPSHDFRFCFPRTPEFHTFAASFHSHRKFDGVGPSISWNASVPIIGDVKDEVLTVDWGINAAVLFGRQRAVGDHHESGRYYGAHGGTPTSYSHAASFDRSRRVTIPDLGGMLGMSLVFPNAKVSIGYRGDFFFGAMDQGIDTRKTGITGFYGPFASISVGLGD